MIIDERYHEFISHKMFKVVIIEYIIESFCINITSVHYLAICCIEAVVFL